MGGARARALCDKVDVDETLVGGRALWEQIAARSAARDGQAGLSFGALSRTLRGSGWLSYGATVKGRIMSLSSCSTIWQW